MGLSCLDLAVDKNFLVRNEKKLTRITVAQYPLYRICVSICPKCQVRSGRIWPLKSKDISAVDFICSFFIETWKVANIGSSTIDLIQFWALKLEIIVREFPVLLLTIATLFISKRMNVH